MTSRDTGGLPVTLLQLGSSTDPTENRASLRSAVTGVPPGGLVVLPEAFAREFGEPGGSVAPFAEPLDGPFVRAVEAAAEQAGATLVAGMFERNPDRPDQPWNTLVVRGAVRTTYRKIHLYDSFGYLESDAISPGPLDQPGELFDLGGFRVGLMTCYDLRFPELARRLAAGGADLLVLPAAWVAGPGKVHHWRTLACARAIENTAYVVAVGQPGPRYSGHSLVVDPAGEVLLELGEGAESATLTLRPDLVRETRQRNPSLRNRRL